MSTRIDAYGQFKRWNISETTAGTLYEGNSIDTGAYIGRGGGQAIEIYHVLGQLKFPQDLPATGATEDISGCVSTRSGLTSMPSLDEEHVIYKRGIVIKAGVATYLPLVVYENDMARFQAFDPPLLISHSKLYPYVDSTNSSTMGQFIGYYFYMYVDIDGDLAIEALEAFR